MDDLQLLELLERAKEKQRGPQGAVGVGIDSIEQFDGQSFTIKLTTGESKKISLPIPKDGDVGQPGVAGPKGDPGVSGSAGRNGADGLQGQPGPRGTDGSFVDTAVVNSSGDLLLSLSTGEIINVGRVVGPAGATGSAGPTGLPGKDGADGAAVLSGPRAPQQDDGFEGCFWIDISSAEFSFYKKGGNGWSKLANLRQPAKDTRVGAGAGGGSGSGGTAQTTATLPLANPSAFKNQSRTLPPSGGLKTQQHMNEWVYAALIDVESGSEGPPGKDGEDGKDGVVDPSALNMVFNTDQIELVDASGNFCGLHVKGANGITVTEDPTYGNQTMVISGETAALEDRLNQGEHTQGELIASQIIQNEQLDSLQNQVDELVITKGSVAIYQVKSTSGGVSSRNGEVIFNAPDAVDIAFISFAAFDSNGTPTKLCATGDIIEFISVADDKVSRFKITTGGDPQALLVEYLGGDNNFTVNAQHETYIYPQNEQGASITYVDAQDDLKLNLSGGFVTGTINSKTAKDANVSAFAISEPTGSKRVLDIWCPGGTGTQTKYVGRYGTDHWFQVYDANDDNVKTTAEFGYKEYFLNAQSGVSYNASDKHSFTGDAEFSGRVTYNGPVENNKDIVTKEYVDESIGTLPEGIDDLMTLTGTQLVSPGNWRIQQANSTGGTHSYISVDSEELNLYHLPNPTTGHHAANKSYVDSEVRHAGGVTGSRPPGLRFQYKSGSSIPPSGKLGYFTDSGEKRLMISTTSLDFAWGTDMPRKDIDYGEGHLFTIWTIQNSKWKMKTTGTLSRMDLHPDRLYAFISYAADVNGSWSTTASYYITISGLF